MQPLPLLQKPELKLEADLAMAEAQAKLQSTSLMNITAEAENKLGGVQASAIIDEQNSLLLQ